MTRWIHNRPHNKFKYVFKIIVGLCSVRWNAYRSILIQKKPQHGIPLKQIPACTYHSIGVRVQRRSDCLLLAFHEIRKLWPPVQIDRKVCRSYGTGHNVQYDVLQLYFVHGFAFNVSHLGQRDFYLKLKNTMFVMVRGTCILLSFVNQRGWYRSGWDRRRCWTILSFIWYYEVRLKGNRSICDLLPIRVIYTCS